jgi:hypothetical protein
VEENKIYTGGNCGWSDLLGAGFGGFLGAALGNGGLFGNNGNAAAATMAAAGTDSISRQVLAGQQEQQMQAGIAGVNGRIDALGSQMQAQASAGIMQGGFAQVGDKISDLNLNINSIARDMQSCCCQQKQLALEQGYQTQLGIERQTNTLQQGFSSIGYLIQQQGQMLAANDAANTQKILDWLCNSKQLELQTTLQQVRDENGRLKQTQDIINALKTTGTAA